LRLEPFCEGLPALLELALAAFFTPAIHKSIISCGSVLQHSSCTLTMVNIACHANTHALAACSILILQRNCSNMLRLTWHKHLASNCVQSRSGETFLNKQDTCAAGNQLHVNTSTKKSRRESKRIARCGCLLHSHLR